MGMGTYMHIIGMGKYMHKMGMGTYVHAHNAVADPAVVFLVHVNHPF